MPKLLIVDDEPDTREFVGKFFKKRGISVFVASSRVEALAFVDKESPDLLLLDVCMETEATGLEILRELRKAGNNVKVIMVSGLNADDVVKEADSLGVLGYIHKPFILEELEKVVLTQLQ